MTLTICNVTKKVTTLKYAWNSLFSSQITFNSQNGINMSGNCKSWARPRHHRAYSGPKLYSGPKPYSGPGPFGALLELVPHFLFLYSYRICTFVYFHIFQKWGTNSKSEPTIFRAWVPTLESDLSPEARARPSFCSYRGMSVCLQ